MDYQHPHTPPKGYTYEATPFKRNVIAIWIRNHRRFDYNLGDEVRSIWGFYDTKTKTYYSAVSASIIGEPVSLEQTTPYSATIPKTNVSV